MPTLPAWFRGALFVVMALAVAAVVALATYGITRFVLRVEWDLLPTLISGMVVGLFFALIVVGPVTKNTTFQVDAVEEVEEGK
jgi:hypothetical protein